MKAKITLQTLVLNYYNDVKKEKLYRFFFIFRINSRNINEMNVWDKEKFTMTDNKSEKSISRNSHHPTSANTEAQLYSRPEEKINRDELAKELNEAIKRKVGRTSDRMSRSQISKISFLSK